LRERVAPAVHGECDDGAFNRGCQTI
jgi:hypothetical protein